MLQSEGDFSDCSFVMLIDQMFSSVKELLFNLICQMLDFFCFARRGLHCLSHQLFGLISTSLSFQIAEYLGMTNTHDSNFVNRKTMRVHSIKISSHMLRDMLRNYLLGPLDLKLFSTLDFFSPEVVNFLGLSLDLGV